MVSPVLEHLAQRLDETIAWCRPRVHVRSPAACLRTLTLAAADKATGAPVRALDYSDTPRERHARVESVASRRRLLLGVASATRARFALRGHPGRVMAFMPDAYLHEQLEADECGGYIDLAGNPPCDTWLAYLDDADGILLAWVPEEFTDGVQRAISVNPTDSLAWLEDVRCGIAAEYVREH